MRHTNVTLLALFTSGLLAACGTENAGGSAASATAVSVEARLGSAPAAPSEALVLWGVSSGQPDYLYLWGRADVEHDSFKLALRGRPPAQAINSYGLGVGMIVIAARSAGLHDGMQSKEDEPSLQQALGASEQQAIIYVDHDQADAYIESMSATTTAAEREHAREHWLFDFPEGYSCGTGRAARSGETFDAYVPVDCSEVRVRLGDLDTFEFPNWT
jgi:hypothetical protein